jgi:hypothetical protein
MTMVESMWRNDSLVEALLSREGLNDGSLFISRLGHFEGLDFSTIILYFVEARCRNDVLRFILHFHS